MAILSKIRDRSVALIAVIGLALFAFVLDPSQLLDFFNSSQTNTVGEVDGEPISRVEFTERLDAYRARTRNRATEMQAAKFVWDNLVREKIYTKQLEDAGITLGEEDIMGEILESRGVKDNPQFLNEVGLFDEDKFKLFLKNTQEDENQDMWMAWQDYMSQIASNFKRNTYNNLLNAGLGSSLKEGEFKYLEENTKFSAELVYIPYSTVPDSTIVIKKKEIAAYIDKHKNEFKVDASRSLSYVKFDLVASNTDKENIKKELTRLIEDRVVENKVSKINETLKGFKSTTDYATFFDENQSDTPYDEFYRMEDRLPKDLYSSIEKGNTGDVFGPYEEGKFIKLLKVTDIVKRPDSVKSSHILIPYIGSASANQNTVKTEEMAKKSADSILKLVRTDKKKFAEIADQINPDGTKGKGGDIGWVKHASANSPSFDSDFAAFIFDNEKGKVEVVKSKFGFHIIRIDDQKNQENAYKTVIFSREIEPSETTETEVFQKAEQFAADLAKGEDTFFNLAKKEKYTAKPAVGLKVLDERVPGITGNAREMIVWSFQKDRKMNDFKRFDLDKSYVVVFITEIVEEGLQDPSKATNKVRPILVNERKAAIIKEKMNGTSLEEIAKSNNQTVRKVNGVALSSPSITGVGFEPNVVGAMFKAKENTLINKVEGSRGVFAFKITKIEKPTALPNYESYRQQIADKNKNRTTKVFDALKETVKLEDNRPAYYGIDN